MNQWENFTENNLPPTHVRFQLMYKGMLWLCELDQFNQIEGHSPIGEAWLYTDVERILQHDKENGDQTKWRRL